MHRHEFDAVSLAAGLLFVCAGVGYLLSEFTEISVDARWAVPVVFVVVGVVGMSAVLAGMRRGAEQQPPPDDALD